MRHTTVTIEARSAWRAAGALTLLAFTAGCTWIRLTDGGSEVMQLSRHEAGDCRLVGNVTTSTQHRVLLQRGSGKVAEELIVLARNEAALLGGNAIAPLGPPVDGRQDFEVYVCHPR